MTELWPWLALAGLGAFHGLNPAMGWLFAVALGMHRHSRAALFQALPAIAFGHALSIISIAGLILLTGIVISQRLVLLGAGLLLIGWSVHHYFFGHRHRVRIGLQTGLAGLLLWSFLMATAHGAGLMVLPALMPLCLAASPLNEITAQGSVFAVLAAVGLHSGVMLAVTGLVAVSIYEWIGLEILRKAWINIDVIWTMALAAMGIALLAPMALGQLT
jgi:hypothetical protein